MVTISASHERGVATFKGNVEGKDTQSVITVAYAEFRENVEPFLYTLEPIHISIDHDSFEQPIELIFKNADISTSIAGLPVCES